MIESEMFKSLMVLPAGGLLTVFGGMTFAKGAASDRDGVGFVAMTVGFLLAVIGSFIIIGWLLNYA